MDPRAATIVSKAHTPLLSPAASRAAIYAACGHLCLCGHLFIHAIYVPAARGPPLLHHWSSLIILVCSVQAKRFDCSRFFYIHFENLEFHPVLTQGRFYGRAKGG